MGTPVATNRRQESAIAGFSRELSPIGRVVTACTTASRTTAIRIKDADGNVSLTNARRDRNQRQLHLRDPDSRNGDVDWCSIEASGEIAGQKFVSEAEPKQAAERWLQQRGL